MRPLYFPEIMRTGRPRSASVKLYRLPDIFSERGANPTEAGPWRPWQMCRELWEEFCLVACHKIRHQRMPQRMQAIFSSNYIDGESWKLHPSRIGKQSFEVLPLSFEVNRWYKGVKFLAGITWDIHLCHSQCTLCPFVKCFNFANKKQV